MKKLIHELLKQADYDFKTANAMFKSARYIYVVFMCHLALEKTLKAIYAKKSKKIAPKSHNLIYFIEKMNIDIPKDIYNFLFTLNRVSIPTRYPEDLEKLKKDYNKVNSNKILAKTEECLKCLKERLTQ